MLQRAIFIYGFFVVAVVSTGAAVWQALETNLREEQLADATQLLTAARNEARTFKEKAQIADRRIRVLESTAAGGSAESTAEQPEGSADSDAKLRAELAAAKQQLAAAETAIRETEDRLAEEISQHAELKSKAQELMDEVAAAGRAIAAAEAKTASRSGAPSSKSDDGAPVAVVPAAPDTSPAESEATGSLPDASTADTAEPSLAPKAASKLKKAQQRRQTKPVIRAVKPIGSPFEPML